MAQGGKIQADLESSLSCINGDKSLERWKVARDYGLSAKGREFQRGRMPENRRGSLADGPSCQFSRVLLITSIWGNDTFEKKSVWKDYIEQSPLPTVAVESHNYPD